MSTEISSVTITNNTRLVREALTGAANAALQKIGSTAEKHVKDNMTDDVPDAVDTGWLRNNMTHIVEGDSVYVGTNVEYAKYVELGTGAYASNGNGRPGWWVYVVDGDENYQSKSGKTFYTEGEAKRIAAFLRSKGLDAHATNGTKPHHMIRRAVTEHTDEYKEIVKKIFENYE